MKVFQSVTFREVTLYFRRMSTLLNAGVPLSDALEYLEKDEENPEFRRIQVEILGRVQSGYPLSLALKDSPKVFPRVGVEMIANSEKTGGLVETLSQIADLYERSTERTQRIRGALAYPACLFLVMMGVVLLFVTILAPGDEGLFAVLGDDIPWPSQVLITASKILTNPVLMTCLLVVVSTGALLFRRLFHHNPELQRWLDEAKLNLPVLGHFLIRLESARMVDTLAGSLDVGLDVLSALDQSSRVVVNGAFRADLGKVTQAIMEGAGLGEALAEHSRLPRLATSLIEVGEVSGELDTILRQIAIRLDEDCEHSLDQLAALAEPLLLMAGGIAAGFVAIATFLPIMRLVSNL